MKKIAILLIILFNLFIMAAHPNKSPTINIATLNSSQFDAIEKAKKLYSNECNDIEISKYFLQEDEYTYIISIEIKSNDALHNNTKRGGGQSFYKVIIEKSDNLRIKENRFYRSR